MADKQKIDRLSDELDLPSRTRVIFYYRNDQFHFVDGEAALRQGDEVVILTHAENQTDLKKRWDPEQTDEDD